MNEVGNIKISTTNNITGLKNTNFKAKTNYATSDIDTFVKEHEAEKKKAKRKENFYYGFLGLIAATAIGGLILTYKSTQGMGKKASELKELWQDITKSAETKDLALPDSLKEFTQKFKNSISNPQVLKDRGGKPVKSVLLYGPPGTGKTTFAKALAKEFPDSKFAALDVTSLGSEYASVSERNLNKAVDMICKEADANPNKKFFVFIDEIDSVMMVDNSLSAKSSNDMLNEFKKCFTEKLGKRDNIITIGATNLEINVEKGMTMGGKQLDRPMLDRFSEKILVDLPTSSQASNSIAFHYKNCALVGESLKNASDKDLNTLTDFLSKKQHNTSFRTLDSIYDATASSFKEGDTTSKVELIDLVRTIKKKQHEMNFSDTDFNQLLTQLKINSSKL